VDVHIGEITAEVDATGDGGVDEAGFERIVRRVMALIERRERAEARSKRDCAIESADFGDLERYG
jgi:hypothetical protein